MAKDKSSDLIIRQEEVIVSEFNGQDTGIGWNIGSGATLGRGYTNQK